MPRAWPATSARWILLLVLGAAAVGCDDTTLVVRSGVPPAEGERGGGGGGLVVAVSSGDRLIVPRAAQQVPDNQSLQALPAEAPLGTVGPVTPVPALGSPARAIATLMLVWIAAQSTRSRTMSDQVRLKSRKRPVSFDSRSATPGPDQ